jgi:phosphatidylinositol glycan class M
MTYFVQPARTDPGATFPWLEPKRLLKLIHIWAVRLFTPVPLLFLVTSLSTFVGLTWLGVQLCGEEALEEGLLYHFSRVDHRHNYSMYWYWIYLAIARPETNLKLMGRLLLIPQVALLLYSSLVIAAHNLGLAMFVQTYLFVTHNKVITAQYFKWYLCLLPLCSDSLALTRHVQIDLLGLGLSIVFWLGSAYCLEMLGLAVHRLVWVASVVYCFANLNLMGALLRSYKTKQGQKKNENYTISD